MKRRQFLSLMAAVSSAPLFFRCAPNQSNPLRRIVSTDGLLELSLKAQSGKPAIAGKAFQLLTYNGQVPAPILEANAGDTVRLALTNQLDAPTNLHYHGLHISPQIDDVFREVAPGESYTYEFQIPQNHPAITGWYHPHYHLNVASQVFGGLAGPLIIRGDLDDVPELRQAAEALLMLQDFDPQNTLREPHALGKRWGREGSLLTASGQQNPVIKLPQNGLLRLRLINASASRIYQLQLPEHPWFLIATDRGAIAEPTELDTLQLSPGERADLLIPGQRDPKDYEILSLPYDRGIANIVESLGDEVEQISGVVPPTQAVMATLRYQPSDRVSPLPMPQKLIPVAPLPAPQTTREFVLNHGIDSTAGSTGFIINGQSFVMDRVNTQVRLNQVEDWRIINQASMDHPFHLHTNRFQVIERNGQPETLLTWKDTVGLKGYETVTIRVRFEDFIGRTVYHCHILDHEDQGMMGILDIQPA
ncbi:multicopper oxidase family protein [Leptolyngbya iicbica]|jgi:FtsP/CotA-like multicopper oxidase with cupredoxin domain|uniref:Multicopper oxidase family protein n=2 Tax=Cyanophyceae TaxID=3028117 RepID=A0A4Q7E9K5_9CYAN|nr:multicopper oxidase family protein [Leptolyngbya sp. LK]RZM79114.1 multicopper oxidase family protein [Leptolyngbya sp. LK]